LDKTAALNSIGNAIRNINLLRKGEPFSSEHVRWLIDTRSILQDIFGQNSTLYRNFLNLKFVFEGTFISSQMFYEIEKQQKDSRAYQSDLTIAEGILHAAIDQIHRKGLEGVYEGKDTPKESSELIKILSLVDNKLRKAIRTKPQKESEVNDALESLFIGADLDKEYIREKESISYSSKTYYPDFTLKRIDAVVEGKLCDSPKREKEIIAEINDDILAYKAKYGNLIFAVYDLGFIRDIEAFAGSIEQSQQHIIVRVIKH